MDDIILTFGKHTGKKLSEIPADYVTWLAEKAFNQDVKRAAQAWIAAHPLTVQAIILGRFSTAKTVRRS